MSLKWKYSIKVENKSLEKVEKDLSIKYPDDFRKLIYECNAGKPSKDCFDIHNRKQCTLNYMISVNEKDTNFVTSITYKMWDSGLAKDLIPIGLDPFGNIIAYKKTTDGELNELIFWNHENKEETYIAKTFSIFLRMLY